MAAAPEGYTGQLSLGGATFSLAIDAGSFERELAKAGQTAQQVSQQIGQSLGRGGSAAIGLHYLGYAIDDLQYGFSAIVNNIPQLVMGLGAGAGVAGALGIVGVAASQVVSHWDTLAEAFTGVQATLPTLSKDFAELAYQLKDIDKQIEELGAKRHAAPDKFSVFDEEKLAKLKDLAAEARKTMAIEKAIEATGPAFANKEGTANFLKATGALPEGSTTLIKELMNKMTPEEANRLVGEALLGAGWAQKQVMEGLGKAPIFQNFKSSASGADAAFEKAVRQIDDAIDEAAKSKAKEGQDLTAEGAANEQRLKAQLEAERYAKQKELNAARDAAQQMRPAQQFGSMRDYLSSVSVAGADGIRKQQLKKLEGIEKGIEKLNDQIKAIGQAKFQ